MAVFYNLHTLNIKFAGTATKILFACLLIPNVAFANEADLDSSNSDEAADTSSDEMQTASDVRKDSHEMESRQPDRGDMGASEYARSLKKINAEIGPGLLFSAVPGMQYGVHYQLLKDFEIGVLYGSGSIDLKDSLDDEEQDGVTIEKADLTGNMFAISARYFLGNSFYVLGGLGSRNIEASIDITADDIDYGIEGKIKASSTVFALGLGNQWRWESGFTLGCEWVGAAIPLASSSSGEIEEKGSFSGSNATKDSIAEMKESAEDTAELIGEATTARLFILSVGWAF